MQLSISLFALCGLLPLVLGGWAPVYRFNNGVVQDGLDCPGDEWTLVKETMVNATRKRRRLGGGADHRELNHKCSGCGSYCAHIGHGCASGRRRRLMDDEGSEDTTSRQLQNNVCTTDVAAIDASLTKLTPRLSSKCQALLNAPRNVTCVQTSMNCHIDSISLWSALNRKLVLANFSTGTVTTFCNGPLPLTFRADTNFNLGTVSFLMNGPGGLVSNRTATIAPYFMHESLATSAMAGYSLPGFNFPPGNYTLAVSADEDMKQAKTYRFRVNQCIGPF